MLLQPKSMKGLTILNKHGHHWILVRRSTENPLTKVQGAWALIQPVEGNDEHLRWINVQDDTNFSIMKTGGPVVNT